MKYDDMEGMKNEEHECYHDGHIWTSEVDPIVVNGDIVFRIYIECEVCGYSLKSGNYVEVREP